MEQGEEKSGQIGKKTAHKYLVLFMALIYFLSM